MLNLLIIKLDPNTAIPLISSQITIAPQFDNPNGREFVSKYLNILSGYR